MTIIITIRKGIDRCSVGSAKRYIKAESTCGTSTSEVSHRVGKHLCHHTIRPKPFRRSLIRSIHTQASDIKALIHHHRYYPAQTVLNGETWETSPVTGCHSRIAPFADNFKRLALLHGIRPLYISILQTITQTQIDTTYDITILLKFLPGPTVYRHIRGMIVLHRPQQQFPVPCTPLHGTQHMFVFQDNGHGGPEKPCHFAMIPMSGTWLNQYTVVPQCDSS